MVLLRLLAFKPKSPSDASNAMSIASAPAEKKTSELAQPQGIAQGSRSSKSSLPEQPESLAAKNAIANSTAPFSASHDHLAESQLPQAPATNKLSANSSSPPLAKTSEGDFWNQLVREMVEAQAINALVRELALQSQLIARDDKQWSLQVDKDSLNTPSNRDRLQAALAQFGHDVQLSVATGPVLDSTAKRLTQENAERQARAEAIILQDPFVQSLMRDFDAKIVPGSIKPV
jgi:DNA polymerase-3 subunit gamma/tau